MARDTSRLQALADRVICDVLGKPAESVSVRELLSIAASQGADDPESVVSGAIAELAGQAEVPRSARAWLITEVERRSIDAARGTTRRAELARRASKESITEAQSPEQALTFFEGQLRQARREALEAFAVLCLAEKYENRCLTEKLDPNPRVSEDLKRYEFAILAGVEKPPIGRMARRKIREEIAKLGKRYMQMIGAAVLGVLGSAKRALARHRALAATLVAITAVVALLCLVVRSCGGTPEHTSGAVSRVTTVETTRKRAVAELPRELASSNAGARRLAASSAVFDATAAKTRGVVRSGNANTTDGSASTAGDWPALSGTEYDFSFPDALQAFFGSRQFPLTATFRSDGTAALDGVPEAVSDAVKDPRWIADPLSCVGRVAGSYFLFRCVVAKDRHKGLDFDNGLSFLFVGAQQRVGSCLLITGRAVEVRHGRQVNRRWPTTHSALAHPWELTPMQSPGQRCLSPEGPMPDVAVPPQRFGPAVRAVCARTDQPPELCKIELVADSGQSGRE